MLKWIEVSEERYDEMLGVLPPALWNTVGFLVGEPNDHVICAVTGRIAPNFAAFAQVGGKFYEADHCLTMNEFKRITAQDILDRAKVTP